jgi:lysophospholipase L1-like esterase
METVSETGAVRSGAKRFIVPVIALGFLGFGFAGWDLSDWRWGVLGVALYAVPLVCCAFRSVTIRAWGLWFGVFLVAQTGLARLLPFPPNDYVTLPPNMHVLADPRATDLHGISGLQTVTTDGHGFRVQPPVNYDQSDALRIFAIGGSTTECLSLDDNATWPHLLQEGLSKQLGKPVQVVNTGVSGSRARYHLTTLHYVLDLHPSAVIILVGANDWVRQIQRHFGTLPLWLEDIQLKHTLLGLALQRGIATVAGMFTTHDMEAEVPVDRGVDVRRWQHSLDRPDKRRFTPDAVEPGYADYLERISALCHEAKLTCIFVTQPTAYSLEASEAIRATFWMTPGFKSYTLPLEDMIRIAALYNRFLTDFARQHGDKVCDLASALAPSFDNFYDDEHYNTNGARNVADYLVPCVAAALAGH